MNPTNLRLSGELINPSYVRLAESALNAQQNILTELLSQRQLPQEGLKELTIRYILDLLSMMDTNNFEGKCGVGQRESRIFSSIVRQRHFSMGHGIGRSGDVMANQPKAAGSSLLLQLTRYLTVSALKVMNYQFVDDVLVLPLATGMALTLSLLTLKQLRPNAKYVIWPRIDQKTCLKCIQAANLVPIPIEGRLSEGDSICTDVEAIQAKIKQLGAQNVLAVMTTSSCFAPRVFDSLQQVSVICKKFGVYHLLNNAYGLQCSKIANAIKEAMKIGLDCVVQSTDKNFMVPVGGSIVFTKQASLLEKIITKYPGRACGAPIVDLFITLLEMGKTGLKTLYESRKENFKYMRQQACKMAAKYNERVLETKRNSISLAITVGNVLKGQDQTQLGSILYGKNVMGHRVLCSKPPSTVFGLKFSNYGTHVQNYPHLPYLNIACAIGTQRKEITQFFIKLDQTFNQMKKSALKKQFSLQKQLSLQKQPLLTSLDSRNTQGQFKEHIEKKQVSDDSLNDYGNKP